MNKDLINRIEEIYDGGAWEAVTGVVWQGARAWQLFKFEQDVEFEGALWRCVLLAKDELCPEDVEAVERREYILTEAWQI